MHVPCVLTAQKPSRAQLLVIRHLGEGYRVDVVDLRNGWTWCVDLPAPFGTGPRGDEVIAVEGDDVLVGASPAGVVARIGVTAVHDPDPRVDVPLEVRRDRPLPRWPDGVTATPGFERVVAALG